MKTEVPVTLRLSIMQPPRGVRWAVQIGRDALLAPVESADDQLVFEIPLSLGPNQRGVVQLRGAAVQGPPPARFVYVNSGKRAGELRSCWDRRAKVSLARIDIEALQNVVGDVVLEGAIHGTARDSGPACGSVTLMDAEWKLRANHRNRQGP